jgi:acetolactate synthase I/II/III large subunit
MNIMAKVNEATATVMEYGNGVTTHAETRIASYLLTEYLERLGVEVIFGLCGHTVIAFLDALSKSRIRFISSRHEQVAAHAADGYARASGKPGVMLSHLGPGLTNAATGVANAALDSIPMVVIAGDVPSHYYGRHPHQEVNLHRDADQFEIYRPFCKRIYRVDRVEDLPRIVERAFHLTQTGRPGPVLVDVPMDIFSADLPVDAFDKEPANVAPPAMDAAVAARIVGALASAKRPVLYAGGGVLSGRATAELAALAEALEIPVAHTLMGKGCMHEEHPLLLGMTGFWGTPIANDTCREADLILAIGTRLAEANSSSWDPRFTFAIPPARLIHMDIDAAEIGRNYSTELGVVCDAKQGLGALVTAAKGLPYAGRGELRQKIARGREAFAANWVHQRNSDQFPMRPERILAELRRAVPEDGFIVTDVGWNKNGVGQQFPITVPGTFITPSGLATMGFGPSAVLGVKMAQPKRAAVALIGDGAFSSNMSVVATAMEADLAVVWVVMDNMAYGTIAGLENMHYGTTFGCMFECNGQPYSVDYAAVARACGARGITIRAAGELGPALREALASNLPTVIQVPMENAPTPTPGHWNINDIYRPGN